MTIEIKKSIKAVDYISAINDLEERLIKLHNNKADELIWVLEHNDTFTSGTSANENEILNKDIKIINTNRGGKITYHGPGQLIFYFLIDLKRRKKDIRLLISIIEKTIIETLEQYGIKTFSDKKNIGIWFKEKNEIKKVAAIGVRVSKWIAYHGFSLNISCDLKKYENIIPCGIADKGVTNLMSIKSGDYKNIKDILIQNFISNLKSLDI